MRMVVEGLITSLAFGDANFFRSRQNFERADGVVGLGREQTSDRQAKRAMC